MNPELTCTFVIVFFLYVSMCLSAPVDDYYLTQGLDYPDQQKMKLYRDIEEYIPRSHDHTKIENNDNSYSFNNIPHESESQLAKKLSAMKRFQPLRTQTRAGGVVLCLWKVCPAAPWLVSERLR